MFIRYLPIVIVGIVAMGVTGCATKRPPINAEEARLRGEINRLSQSEPVRKAEELRLQMEKFAEGDVRRQPLERQREDYLLTPEWRAYALLKEQSKAREESRYTLEWAAARETIARRHGELRALALASASSPAGGNAAASFDAMTFPRIDGSTSTQPLAVIIASRALGCDYGWIDTVEQRHRLPWSSGINPPPIPVASMRACARSAGQKRTAEIVDAAIAVNAGTHQAYVNLIEGVCQVNLTVRKPSVEEAELARRRGVVLEMEPVALDALVFMMNTANPITSLSRDQIRAIYSNKPAPQPPIAGWPRLAVVREPNSGSRELFEQLVLGSSQTRQKNEESYTKDRFGMSMTGPFDIVSTDHEAIGYSVHYYEQYMAISPQTRAIAVDGILPSRQTIASGQYPFVFPIYVVYRKGVEANGPVMQLVGWLKTPQGQAAIRESGYVPAAGERK